MKINQFFLWCAGSDTELLNHCSNSERIKHIGFGTLVLIPAILAFVSMSYALSTIELLVNKPVLYYLGGLVWAFIIFSFDRFIVSTHRRKKNNLSEFNNPAFFLRLGFALILGIVISHPLMMLYFDGSITDQIHKNVSLQKQNISQQFDQKIDLLNHNVFYLDSLDLVKEKERNEQESVVAKEIDGEVIQNSKGEIITTGLYGKGPSAENKINHLNQLQRELVTQKQENKIKRAAIQKEIQIMKSKKDSSIQAYTISFDYLKRELALEELKEENSIVGLTQFMLILLFILVDILPFIFKTFSPFGLYDKILTDDETLLKELDHDSRKKYLEEVYGRVSQV